LPAFVGVPLARVLAVRWKFFVGVQVMGQETSVVACISGRDRHCWPGDEGGDEAHGSDGSARHWDPARAKRRQVAEENERMLGKWPTARTVEVTPGSCPSRQAPWWGCCGSEFKGEGDSVQLPLVSVSTWNTADAVMNLTSLRRLQPGTICILNFANGTSRSVGGGYRTGASAQEEDLCRRIPNLYPSLANAKQEDFYPYGPSTYGGPHQPGRYSNVLFTLGVTLARLSEREEFRLLDQRQELQLSVVSAAAPNIGFASEAVVPELMMETVRSIFLAPQGLQPSLRILVLGAWGCGAFRGDAKQVSQLFATAISSEGLGSLYDEVHFAIPGGRNHDVFAKTLREAGIPLARLK